MPPVIPLHPSGARKKYRLKARFYGGSASGRVVLSQVRTDEDSPTVLHAYNAIDRIAEHVKRLEAENKALHIVNEEWSSFIRTKKP